MNSCGSTHRIDSLGGDMQPIQYFLHFITNHVRSPSEGLSMKLNHIHRKVFFFSIFLIALCYIKPNFINVLFLKTDYRVYHFSTTASQLELSVKAKFPTRIWEKTYEFNYWSISEPSVRWHGNQSRWIQMLFSGLHVTLQN